MPIIDIAPLTGHQQVTDLHLVNLCARAGLTLATFDAALPTWLVPADRRHVELLPSWARSGEGRSTSLGPGDPSEAESARSRLGGTPNLREYSRLN